MPLNRMCRGASEGFDVVVVVVVVVAVVIVVVVYSRRISKEIMQLVRTWRAFLRFIFCSSFTSSPKSSWERHGVDGSVQP